MMDSLVMVDIYPLVILCNYSFSGGDPSGENYHPVKDVYLGWSLRIFLWFSELLSPLIIAESKGKI